MNKEPKPKIPLEVVEKERRYRIMTKMAELEAVKISDAYKKLGKTCVKIMDKFDILSNEGLSKQLEILVNKGLLLKKGKKIIITAKGREYASSIKGESYEFLSNY